MRSMDIAEFDHFADVASSLSSEARADFKRFWAQLDLSDIAAARNAAIEYVTALVEVYGNAASLNAAEFFEEASGTANAYAVDSVNAKRIDGTVRYAMGFAIDGMAERALATILDDMDLQIKGAGRDTMLENARRSGMRFARIPRGSSTCAFCNMLASRGFVYHTKETAGYLNRFHPHCDCQIVAGVQGDEIEGYDIEARYRQYLDDLADGNLSIDSLRKSASKKPGKHGGTGRWGSKSFSSYSDFTRFVEGAESIEDLQERCAVAAEEWKKTGLSDRYWGQLKQAVMKKRSELSALRTTGT